MQAKKRYLLVFVSCAFLAYCYFGGYRLKSEGAVSEYMTLPSYFSSEEYLRMFEKDTSMIDHPVLHTVHF